MSDWTMLWSCWEDMVEKYVKYNYSLCRLPACPLDWVGSLGWGTQPSVPGRKRDKCTVPWVSACGCPAWEPGHLQGPHLPSRTPPPCWGGSQDRATWQPTPGHGVLRDRGQGQQMCSEAGGEARTPRGRASQAASQGEGTELDLEGWRGVGVTAPLRVSSTGWGGVFRPGNEGNSEEGRRQILTGCWDQGLRLHCARRGDGWSPVLWATGSPGRFLGRSHVVRAVLQEENPGSCG